MRIAICCCHLALVISWLAIGAVAAGASPSAEPIMSCEWTPKTAPSAKFAPKVVPFRDEHGLQFVAAKHTLVNLTDSAGGKQLRLTGPLSLSAVVQLTGDVPYKSPFVSKWTTAPGRRSYELGVMSNRRLYFAISGSGDYDAKARELFGTRLLKVGTPYAVTAVFEPGKRMAIYINGVPSGELRRNVPERIFDSPTSVLLGARPPGHTHWEGILGGVWFCDRALDESAIKGWCQKLDLTQPPEPETPTFESVLMAPKQDLPPVRTITRGSKFHWFGSYDKFQFDPTERYVLSMETDFEHRSPQPDDVIKIGMVDLEDGDRWIELAKTRAWCWQQGCMLQWRPGSDSEILFNDRDGDRYVCRVLDTKTGKQRILPRPIHHVSPDGRWALCTDPGRVATMRRGYGYVGAPVPDASQFAPPNSGLWKMDLQTGQCELIVTLKQIADIPYPGRDPSKHRHYFNHIQWSPDGKRFLFLNRGTGVVTRMFTAAADGGEIRLVNLNSSHYTWRDPKSILVWVGSYNLVPDDGSLRSEVAWRAPNGHQSYVPGTNLQWVVTDTYPMAPNRSQHIYLHHLPTKRFVPLGHFHSPPKYSGEWRCDTHPRISRSGRFVCFDSSYRANGRQLHLIDISRIVGPDAAEQ